MKKILNKILEEINKPEPRLDYIRGLIEASVEEDGDKFILADGKGGVRVTTHEKEIKSAELMDEASIMEAETKAFIAKNGMPKMQEG